MRKIKLYIAISLDGKIAKTDGSVDWLENMPNPENSDFGYGNFIAGVDTVLMGNKTYQQVLGFDVPFPYPDQECFVFTRDQSKTRDQHVTFVSSDIPQFVGELKEKEGKDIWLIGGGEINYLLLENGLVDEMIIHLIPIILGDGIPLVSKELPEKFLKLKESKTYPGGAVELRYAT